MRCVHVCVALLASALLCAAAVAQPSAPAPGDLPAGDGSLSGRVAHVNGTPAANVAVSLIAFQPSGNQGLRRTHSDEDGSFRFEAVAADPAIVYFVVAETEGVHHSQRSAFAPGEQSLHVELQIAPLSANTAPARRGDSDVRLERSCSGLKVAETHALVNHSRSVLFVPEGARADAQPILELELPEGASELANPFGATPSGLVREGRRLRFWGPLYPGEQKLEFAYTLAADAVTLSASWGYPTGTRRLTFLADPSLPEVSVTGLDEGDAREAFSRSHRVFEARRLAANARIELHVRLGVTPPLATLREAQLWIELDDAALSIDERLSIEPAQDANEASLLCIALPPDATDLRFSQATLSLRIARDPSGALELRGPLPPGEQLVSLHYQLPVSGDHVDFERRFGVPVPLLGVFVSDTGVLPETTRLHRRRPLRRVDRNYLHLEAFQLEPEETVKIRFTRLEAPRSLPQSATVGFAVLLAGGLLAFLGGPLRRTDGAADAGETPAERLLAERESVYAAIRDLDEDFDTAKLTVEDHTQLRGELRARAVRLLEAERRAAEAPLPPAMGVGHAAPSAPSANPRQPAPVPPPAPATANISRPSLARPTAQGQSGDAWRFCPKCGGELPAQPRFCPHCGDRLPGAGGGA
jgi:hypothetical protein